MIKKKDSNAEYHSKDSLSSSALKSIYKTSVKAWLNQNIKPSKAMAFGTAVHTALLEPEVFDDEIVIKPNDIDRRTKIGKEAYNEFIEKSKGKTIIESEDKILIEEIKKEVDKKDYIKYYLEGEKELSHYGKFLDLNCRCRPDCINYEKSFISDIKTTQDTHPAAFQRDSMKWAYHLQAAFYSDFCGIPAENFRFIVISSKIIEDRNGNRLPYADVQLIKMGDQLISMGRKAYLEAMDKYKLFQSTGISDLITWDYIDDNDQSFIINGYGKH